MDIFIQKNKSYEQGGNKPYFRITKKEGDTFVDIGAAWLKLDKNGNKFYSGKLNDNLNVQITNISEGGDTGTQGFD